MDTAWPNHPRWSALTDGARIETGNGFYVTTVIDCGDLVLPTGRLVACDPFAMMQARGNPEVQVTPGRYPVRVTLADVSGAGDGSHMREAYASLILSPAPETTRRILTPLPPGGAAPDLEPGEFVGVPVDAGTACFVDAGALEHGLPDAETWDEDLFDNGTETSWFGRMDDPAHIREGLANIPLPLATDGANLILFHSGYGDGHYPLLGGFDAHGALVAVHVDFFVIRDTAPAQTE